MTSHHNVAPTTSEPAPLVEPWAHWGLRVAATLIDSGLQLPFIVLAVMFNSPAQDARTSPIVALVCSLIGLVVSLAGFCFGFWNSVIRQGRRGASIGKEAFGLLVLSLEDARPIGAGRTFLRNFAHLADVLTLGIGYLWPLLDERRQTFADKIVNTGVLRIPDVRF